MYNYLDIFSDNHMVEVILPMGATNINVKIPFDVEEIDYTGKSFNTLDFLGALKITIKLKNLSAHLHNKDFEVTYTLESHWLLAKPIVMAGIVFVFYLLALLYNRVDIDISEKKK